jgi:hypothetical protein
MKPLLVRGQQGHDVAKRQEEPNAICGASHNVTGQNLHERTLPGEA